LISFSSEIAVSYVFLDFGVNTPYSSLVVLRFLVSAVLVLIALSVLTGLLALAAFGVLDYP